MFFFLSDIFIIQVYFIIKKKIIFVLISSLSKLSYFERSVFSHCLGNDFFSSDEQQLIATQVTKKIIDTYVAFYSSGIMEDTLHFLQVHRYHLVCHK
jgi:hypothetical protein